MGYVVLFTELTIIVMMIIFMFLGKVFVKNKKTTPSYTIITAKNNEDCIEGIVLSLINAFKKSHTFRDFHKILIIDLNSTDSTGKILKKLEKKYSFIKVVNIIDI